MALPLQANSLSSITQLAGNPPKYPRNPTEPKKESLVLYIARVPGSRGKAILNCVCATSVLKKNSFVRCHIDYNEAASQKRVS